MITTLKEWRKYKLNESNGSDLPLEKYESIVANGILAKIPNQLKSYLKIGQKEVMDMISGKAINGEFSPNYPDHFDETVDGMWENDKSTEEAINYFIANVLVLLNGQASAI